MFQVKRKKMSKEKILTANKILFEIRLSVEKSFERKKKQSPTFLSEDLKKELKTILSKNFPCVIAEVKKSVLPFKIYLI